MNTNFIASQLNTNPLYQYQMLLSNAAKMHHVQYQHQQSEHNHQQLLNNQNKMIEWIFKSSNLSQPNQLNNFLFSQLNQQHLNENQEFLLKQQQSSFENNSNLSNKSESQSKRDKRKTLDSDDPIDVKLSKKLKSSDKKPQASSIEKLDESHDDMTKENMKQTGTDMSDDTINNSNGSSMLSLSSASSTNIANKSKSYPCTQCGKVIDCSLTLTINI